MRHGVGQVLACACLLLFAAGAWGQGGTVADSDGDGLNDAVEDALLQQFRPTLMVSSDDCSVQPARFQPGVTTTTVVADDGTVYGQAHPYPTSAGAPPQIELRFYHLWRRDCGRLGHALDVEHVAVLLEAGPARDTWHATYWYAAAHEDTMCDASQITRAATLAATDHGATVWISSGKHASFLNEELCQHGCGGDRCLHSTRLAASPVINLGEVNRPENGAVWIASSQWPLLPKMKRSDFTADRVARLQRLPSTDIAWANPAKRPAQAAILGGNSAIDGTLKGGASTGSALATSGRSTDTALILTGSRTSAALGTAAHKMGHALSRAAHSVKHALGSSADETATPPR